MKFAKPFMLALSGLVLLGAALAAVYLWSGDEPVPDIVIAVQDRCYTVIAGEGFVDAPVGSAGCSGDAANVRIVSVRSASGGVHDVQAPIAEDVKVGDSWPR